MGRAVRYLRLALLALALAWLAYATVGPHLLPDGGVRERPIHMDEYLHWGYATQIQRTGSVDAPLPFTSAMATDYTVVEDLHERGFQAFLSVFQGVTGLPWTTVFTWGPAAIAVLAGLAIYALMERWGAGLEAVLWAVAIPTSLRFLGPDFLVPIAASIPLLVAGLLVLWHGRGPGGLILFAVLSISLWTIHTMAAVVLSGAALILVAHTFRERRSWTAGVLLVLAAPVLAAWPYITQERTTDSAVTALLPGSLDTLRVFGPVLYVAAAVGAVALAADRDKPTRALGATLAGGCLAFLGIIVYRNATSIDPMHLYDRSVLMLLLFATLLAGAATAWGHRALRERAPRRLPLLSRAAPVVMVLLLLIPSAHAVRATALERDQPYYILVEDGQWATWSSVGPSLRGHEAAIVDGRGTMAFTILTGLPTPLYVATPAGPDAPEFINRFFAEGAVDTRLLVESGVTVVVTLRPVANPDLIQVAPGVHVLRPDYAERILGHPVG